MRKELILEDAGPQIEEWRETYVEKLTTQLPNALVLSMGNTIKILRRGQRVWIATNKKNSHDIRIVTATRSALIPLGILFLGFAILFMISLSSAYASYMSTMSFYSSYSNYSSGYYYFPPPSLYTFIGPYIPFIVIFLGLGLGVLAINKTRQMQSLALRLARETWLSFKRRVESKLLSRTASPQTPPKTLVTTPPHEQELMLGRFCMFCGTPVEKSGAKFCENCGKDLFS